MRKPLTGREASLLALVAQARDRYKENTEEYKRVLDNLDGDARLISEAIMSDGKNDDPALQAAAQGLIDWANGIDERAKKREQERKRFQRARE